MTRGRAMTAARHLRLLGTIEGLVALGNYSEVRRLLDAVDPELCSELADEIDDSIGAARRPVTSRRAAPVSVLDVWRDELPRVARV